MKRCLINCELGNGEPLLTVRGIDKERVIEIINSGEVSLLGEDYIIIDSHYNASFGITTLVLKPDWEDCDDCGCANCDCEEDDE